jgi:hypothetical protein
MLKGVGGKGKGKGKGKPECKGKGKGKGKGSSAGVGMMMKPKRLKVYARSGLISTKLPIVKDLIEIITHRPMYQNNMKMVLDTYTAIQEGFDVKPRHM